MSRHAREKGTQPPDLHSQAGAMGFVGAPDPECVRDQCLAIDVAGPALREGPSQREQQGAARERDPHAAGAEAATTAVDNEGTGGDERGNVLEAQRCFLIVGNAPGGRTLECGLCLPHFGPQRRYACTSGCLLCAGERCFRRLNTQGSQRELGREKFGDGFERGWHTVSASHRLTVVHKGRTGSCEHCRGLVQVAEQQKSSRRDHPRMQGIRLIAIGFECRRCCRQCTRRPAELAHREQYFGLRQDATRACKRFAGTERPGGAPQQVAGARVFAELRHGDATQRQCRWVVTQRNALQGAECVAYCESARGGADHGVHREKITSIRDGTRSVAVRGRPDASRSRRRQARRSSRVSQSHSVDCLPGSISGLSATCAMLMAV